MYRNFFFAGFAPSRFNLFVLQVLTMPKKLFLILLAITFPAFAADQKSMLVTWGEQSLDNIQKSFLMPDHSLYFLEIHTKEKQHPCWIWDASIQLQALCSAARVEPKKYLPTVKTYATALASYRTLYHNRPGFDVNPPPKPTDRYYDDNGWIAMAFLEAYDLTHDRRHLSLALDAYNFALSGEDDKLGGGIYWHEDRTDTKNTCSSGPTMIAALMLHNITNQPQYLQSAKRLYDWTRSHMQDDDGLVFDHITVPEGKIQGAKVSYNAGTLLKGACMLYQVTGEKKYLDEAERIAHAAENRFVGKSDGLIGGWGKLNVKLIEGFLSLQEIDRDPHWLQLVSKCLAVLHTHQNADGWYTLEWAAPPPDLRQVVRLIDQSAPARAYWIAAEHGVVVDPK